jgi:hypothetical protein
LTGYTEKDRAQKDFYIEEYTYTDLDGILEMTFEFAKEDVCKRMLLSFLTEEFSFSIKEVEMFEKEY